MTKPILSICIPTKNHIAELTETLESIVSSEVFKNTNKIEIVVSDNCSDDNTSQVMEMYCSIHGKKIKYVKNNRDLYGSLNFEKALSSANGVMRKLHNSYFRFSEGAVDLLVELVENFSSKKPVIFFTNGEGGIKGDELFQCLGIDNFVKEISFWSTWIGGFFVWEDDYINISDFNKEIESGISHTEFLLRVISQKNIIVILNKRLMKSQRNWPRGGYNIAQVFGENYLRILKRYIEKKQLTINTFEEEKKKVLLKHILPYYCSDFHNFGNEGILKYLSDYEADEYFYIAMASVLKRRIPK